MRIISGSAKGTKLYTLEGIETRPTLDRVKEALFSILQFSIQESYILDLFAGSGALALEGLSRGAKFAVLCDKSFKAINIIKQNIVKTKFESKTKLMNADYQKCLKKLEQEKLKFDIIFLDPPYKEKILIDSIEKILQANILNEDGIIVAETDEKSITDEIENKEIQIYDIRNYGRVNLIFLSRKG